MPTTIIWNLLESTFIRVFLGMKVAGAIFLAVRAQWTKNTEGKTKTLLDCLQRLWAAKQVVKGRTFFNVHFFFSWPFVFIRYFIVSLINWEVLIYLHNRINTYYVKSILWCVDNNACEMRMLSVFMRTFRSFSLIDGVLLHQRQMVSIWKREVACSSQILYLLLHFSRVVLWLILVLGMNAKGRLQIKVLLGAIWECVEYRALSLLFECEHLIFRCCYVISLISIVFTTSFSIHLVHDFLRTNSGFCWSIYSVHCIKEVYENDSWWNGGNNIVRHHELRKQHIQQWWNNSRTKEFGSTSIRFVVSNTWLFFKLNMSIRCFDQRSFHCLFCVTHIFDCLIL